MINTRPQRSTLVSFILFLIIAYVLVGVNIYVVFRDPMALWFNYLILVILLPAALFVSHKVFFRYKTVSFGEGHIEVTYPQFRSHRKYKLEEVDYWDEAVVKTGETSRFKELEVKFHDGRIIRMAHREYTDYDRMLGYLDQMLPQARRSKP